MNTLYHLPFSANSRLVRIALSEKKIDVKLIVEPVWERRASFLLLNPEGQVPVFLTDKNISLSGSSVIIEWLEDLSSEHSLIGNDINFRAEARRIMLWFNNKFALEVELSKINSAPAGVDNPVTVSAVLESPSFFQQPAKLITISISSSFFMIELRFKLSLVYTYLKKVKKSKFRLMCE